MTKIQNNDEIQIVIVIFVYYALRLCPAACAGPVAESSNGVNIQSFLKSTLE